MFDLRRSLCVGSSRWLAVAAIAVTVCLPVTSFAQNNNDSVSQESLQKARDKFTKLREKFDQANEKKNNVSRNLSSLEKDRRDLNKHLVETGARVKRIEAALSGVEKKLSQLSVREQSIRRSMTKRHEVIAALLAVMQRMGRQPPPVMATHRDDALKMVRSAMLLSAVIPKLSKELKATSSELETLVAVVTETKQNALTLRQETKNLIVQRDRVKKLLNSKKTRILSQQNELQLLKKEARAYSNNAKNLGQLISKLDKNVSRTMGIDNYTKDVRSGKTGISRIDPKTGKKVRLVPTKRTRVTSLINPGRIKPALPFSRAQGLLPLPASGNRVKSYGDTNDYGSTSKGVLLGTRNNAQVTSPCDGWVLYAGRFRSYGQLLIINAGEGYHILLAGMGKIDVSTGQFVLAGEPVASMNSQRLQGIDAKAGYDQTLYIEFRKNERPVNPDPWWAEG